MKKVIGFGALNVDNFFRVENLLLSENPAYPIDVQAGGSAANTIVALAKLGIECGFVGIVANDAHGKLLISEFKGKKVDISNLIIRKTQDILTSSGSLDAFVDKKGRRALFVKPQVNSTLKFSEVNISYLNGSDFLHLSSFVDDEQLELQKKVAQKIKENTKISFSPGSLYCNRGLSQILPIVKKSYVVFLDKKEIYQLIGKNYKIAADELVKLGPKFIAVTLGEDGVYVTDGKKNFHEKARRVKKVQDTTGAGDAFAAGFLLGLIYNFDIQKCAQIGNAIASFSIQKVGARINLPNRKELSSAVSFIK